MSYLLYSYFMWLSHVVLSLLLLYFQKNPELRRKVEQLETRLEQAEAHSLQLEDALHMSGKALHALKDDKRNLQVCR